MGRFVNNDGKSLIISMRGPWRSQKTGGVRAPIIKLNYRLILLDTCHFLDKKRNCVELDLEYDINNIYLFIKVT